jgi:DNA mismatch repair ATPase MutS
MFGDGRRVYKIYLAPRDEAGANAMNELRDRGSALAAGALARSADHVVSFYYQLQTELAFYIGCLGLHGRLRDLRAPFSFPSVTDRGKPRLACKDLYDVSLALSANQRPVGNDINADGKPLIVVTGANQGGKTTFLRSFGLAQLMMQGGMFVGAAQLRANAVDGVFTHFRREEDASMKSGKFDEELGRMSDIVDVIAPHSLLLFNESFAATNEREGSEIARQIATALLERPNKVAFVSHQYAFSHGLFESRRESTLFLRAERRDDGQRTFKLIEGEPLSTSFGEDVYREVFANEEQSERANALRLRVESLDIPPRAGVQL